MDATSIPRRDTWIVIVVFASTAVVCTVTAAEVLLRVIVSYDVLPFSNVAIVSPVAEVIDQLYVLVVSALLSVTVKPLPPLTLVVLALRLVLVLELPLEELPEDDPLVTVTSI